MGDSPSGKPISELFKEQGIVLGIKVDKGVQPLYNTDGETVTQGITGLAERCKKYYARGARFAKWRAVCHIKDSGAPTQLAIDQNAETLARYGAICQASGLVPIIEPEVLMDGKHHILRSAEATQRVQAAVVYAMQRHRLLLEGILLKPNMVRPGASAKPVSAATVARATVRVLQHTLPAAVPGVHFLSGGMTEEFATECLNEMNKLNLGARPWSLSFSFGRARQIRRRCQWQCRCQRLPTRGRLCLLRAQFSHERSALFPNSRIQLFTFLVICQDLICQDFFPLHKIV